MYVLIKSKKLTLKFFISAHVGEASSSGRTEFNHILEDIYIVSPILCVHCKFHKLDILKLILFR